MILCIGTTPTAQRSMTFGRLTLDAVNRASAVSEYASGKSINVARVLATLGRPAVCTGFVGGPRGKMIRTDLDALGIAHDFVTVPTPTRLCTTVIDLATHAATELVEESGAVPAEAWPALDAKVAALARTAKVAVLSGSLTPHAPQDAYARWAHTLLAGGTTVIIDTRGEPLRRVIAGSTGPASGRLVIKLNAHELAETLGREGLSPADLRGAVRDVLPPGGTLVVTLGKDGAPATPDGRTFFAASAPAITPVSAIGSGDAFAAGLAAVIHDAGPLNEALRLAAACGTANALTDRAGNVRESDLTHILAGTVVREA